MKFLTDSWRNFRRIVAEFYPILPRFLGYQVIIKLLFSLIIIPIFLSGVDFALRFSGHDFVTNGAILKLFAHPAGLLIAIMSIALILLGASLEICGTIIIAYRHLCQLPPANFRQTFLASLQLLPRMFGLGMIIVVFYLVILSPLIGSTLSLSFLNWLQVPNFVIDTIFMTPSHIVIYVSIVILGFILSLAWMFGFHFLTLANQTTTAAMRQSRQFVKRHFRPLLKAIIGFFIASFIVVFSIIMIWSIIVSFLAFKLNLDAFLSQRAIIVLFLLQQIILAIASLLLIPFGIFFLTKLFLRFYSQPIYLPKIKPQDPFFIDNVLKHRPTRRTLIIITIIVTTAALSLPLNFFIKPLGQATIISHRAGGTLAAENSLAGLQKSIDLGVKWAEIDVQRTKDGRYLVHHDRNLRRLTGTPHSSQDLSLDELQKLPIINHLPGQQLEYLAGLEDFLIKARNQIGLFIELKGITADQQMVDDIIHLAQQHQMVNQIVLISMRADLIDYAETRHPNLTTGLIYYLSLGNPQKTPADYLIVEEILVSQAFVKTAHQADKKVIVWTVNDIMRAEKHLKFDVDGIVTDNPDVLLPSSQGLPLRDLIINAFEF